MLSCLFWCLLAGVVASWQFSLASRTVRHPRHDPNCSVPFQSLCRFLLAPERTLTHPIRDADFPVFLFLLRGIFPKQLLHLLLGGSQRIWSISLPLTPGKGMALPAHSPFPAALATKGSVVFLSYVTCVHACSQTETSLAFPSWPSRHLEHAWAYVEYVGICGHFWFCSRGHPCWLCIVVHQVQEEKNLLATTSRPLLPFFVCLFVCVPIQ